METLGTLSEGDWYSHGGVYLFQEADFMANFLSLPTEPYEDSIFAVQPTLSPSHESATSLSGRAFCSFDAVYHDGSHRSSNVNMDECIAVGLLPNLGSYDYLDNLITASASISTEICETDAANISYLVDGDDSPRREITGGDESHGDLKDTQLPWGYDDFVETAAAESKRSTSSDKSRKRWQNYEDGNVINIKRKNQKSDLPGKIDEESRGPTHGPGSACLSEVNSSSGRELSGSLPNISSREPAKLNLTGKTRATRGSAIDPQSLYARKRRERINERLRILQKLVPNGTKVDISTMLEEAVHYVKFLQLQIRMLSSDELWMYAPISYNGINIGFDWDTFKSR